MSDLELAVAVAVVMSVVFIAVLIVGLPIRITTPVARLGAALDRLALALGIVEACPTCGAPAEELGRQGDRVWLHCRACGRNPWLAGHPDISLEDRHEASA